MRGVGRPRALPDPRAAGGARAPWELTASGSCADTDDPDIFFDTARQHLAKHLCRTCPVTQLCLTHAIQHETDGIWGGTTPDQRSDLRGAARLITPEERRHADTIRMRLARGVPLEAIASSEAVSVKTLERWRTIDTALRESAA